MSGSAVGVFWHFCEQAFELAFANVFEVGAFGTLRGGFVEIDGNFVTLPDFAADFFREGYAIFDGDAFDGDERDNVGCAHAGMRAGMPGEVNQFGCFADAAQCGFSDGFGFAGYGDDAAVMVCVTFAVEQVDAGNFAHGRDNGVNFGRVAPFGKIRNTFYKSFH